MKDVLDSYSDIELTEEEMMLALIEAKRKKQNELELVEQRRRETEFRSRLTQKTSYPLVKALMQYRAEKKFDSKFQIDQNNEFVFELLCRYFGDDNEFVSLAQSIGVNNPSLSKGIFICGVFGTGKSWMLELFRSNPRMCYKIENSKDIAEGYREAKDHGEEFLKNFIDPQKNAFEDSSVFFQSHIGLCIDDIGTEDLKNNYGNKKNVIGDIIEMRYNTANIGLSFHGSTNLTAEKIESYYGGRVRSRMREIFNFIELPGKDRRK